MCSMTVNKTTLETSVVFSGTFSLEDFLRNGEQEIERLEREINELRIRC
jgi:hypothetical protein